MMVRHFPSDEGGSGTVFALGIVLLSLVFAGLAIDFNKAMSNRTQMQTAGEAVAHAALVTRDVDSVSGAKARALEIATRNLPVRNAISADDIEFGIWDPETGTFTEDNTSRKAVRVTPTRNIERGNQATNILLDLIGVDSFDLAREVVFETYVPRCFREGFVAENRIEIQSQNTFTEGFCIHSNTLVSVGAGNFYEDGVSVSMPDIQDLVMRNSGFDTNPGLEQALHDNSYDIKILERIQAIADGIDDPQSPHYRDYLSAGAPPVDVAPNGMLGEAHFTEGRINRIWCTTLNQQAAIERATVLRRLAIVTNCRMNFGAAVVMEDAVIVNLSHLPAAFYSSSGFQLGKNDNCAEGGDAQIVTMGGIRFPANMELYGGQMIARGNISFSARANGVQGASVVSGGTIDGTSNMIMGFCNGTGMENNFVVPNFRMAQYGDSMVWTPTN